MYVSKSKCLSFHFKVRSNSQKVENPLHGRNKFSVGMMFIRSIDPLVFLLPWVQLRLFSYLILKRNYQKACGLGASPVFVFIEIFSFSFSIFISNYLSNHFYCRFSGSRETEKVNLKNNDSIIQASMVFKAVSPLPPPP